MKTIPENSSKAELPINMKALPTQESLGTLNLGGFPVHPGGNAEYLSKSVKNTTGNVSAHRAPY